jgi:hypothetical protein
VLLREEKTRITATALKQTRFRNTNKLKTTTTLPVVIEKKGPKII